MVLGIVLIIVGLIGLLDIFLRIYYAQKPEEGLKEHLLITYNDGTTYQRIFDGPTIHETKNGWLSFYSKYDTHGTKKQWMSFKAADVKCWDTELVTEGESELDLVKEIEGSDGQSDR